MPREISTPSVSESFLLEKCDFFLDVQLWPLQARLDPRGWLTNFLPSEQEHAISLLNAFQYFSGHLVDEMFMAGFQNLSCFIASPDDPFENAQAKWREFVDSAIITHVEGEVPNNSDSGYSFARRARQLLRINEDRILSPSQALNHLLLNPRSPIVFVDDFVGTGRQFVATWRRSRAISRTASSSFEAILRLYNHSIFYVPVFATEQGLSNINTQCSGVRVVPVHALSPRYGAFSEKSYIWPRDLSASAGDFLYAASMRAGLSEYSWRGLNGLGLAIAFGDSVPDSTLPIIYWGENGWKPLIRRA
jgi:hypothetical protein